MIFFKKNLACLANVFGILVHEQLLEGGILGLKLDRGRKLFLNASRVWLWNSALWWGMKFRRRELFRTPRNTEFCIFYFLPGCAWEGKTLVDFGWFRCEPSLRFLGFEPEGLGGHHIAGSLCCDTSAQCTDCFVMKLARLPAGWAPFVQSEQKAIIQQRGLGRDLWEYLCLDKRQPTFSERKGRPARLLLEKLRTAVWGRSAALWRLHLGWRCSDAETGSAVRCQVLVSLANVCSTSSVQRRFKNLKVDMPSLCFPFFTRVVPVLQVKRMRFQLLIATILTF